ncbi:MAG: hypothetical protein GY810_06550 [Aureispira sp.]|nr:hypothetical protein [Aureispira sp.]
MIKIGFYPTFTEQCLITFQPILGKEQEAMYRLKLLVFEYDEGSLARWNKWLAEDEPVPKYALSELKLMATHCIQNSNSVNQIKRWSNAILKLWENAVEGSDNYRDGIFTLFSVTEEDTEFVFQQHSTWYNAEINKLTKKVLSFLNHLNWKSEQQDYINRLTLHITNYKGIG